MKFLVGIRIMTKNSRAEEMREKSKNASSAWLEFSQKKITWINTTSFLKVMTDSIILINLKKSIID